MCYYYYRELVIDKLLSSSTAGVGIAGVNEQLVEVCKVTEPPVRFRYCVLGLDGLLEHVSACQRRKETFRLPMQFVLKFCNK